MKQTTSSASLAIVAVLRVIDTREYVEDRFDRFVPVAGSGVQRECDRCGREHEVHAYVLLEDRSEACVGTGCSKGDSLHVEAALRRSAAAAKRRAALSAELAVLRAAEAAWSEIEAEVAARPVPVVSSEFVRASTPHGSDRTVLRCGEVQLWCTVGGREFGPAAIAEAERGWRENEFRQAFKARTGRSTFTLSVEIDSAERKLAKLEGRRE